jgi:stage II sporulation protein GA (sporulation sigma-E factor processing peptidase)
MQEYCDINIFINNKSIKIKSLIDTGNNLKDPINGSPVIVVENNIIKGILPENIENRIRIIPFKAIGLENGILKGYRVDKIEILEKKIVKTDVVIAICDFALSKSGEYYALMNPALL